MKTFKYDKLIRDKISDLAIKDGAKLDYSIISGQEKIEALKKKILEEGSEVQYAKNNEELIDELADIQTILDTILQELGMAPEEFESIKQKKNEKRGAFEKGIYAHSMAVDEQHPRYQYFLDNPEKYPEIK